MYKLLEEIIKNGGATIVTTNNAGRYVVGNNKYGSVTPLEDSVNVFELIAGIALLMAADDYSDYDGFGFWIEPDNYGRQMLFADPIKLYQTEEGALYAGRLFGELAIWDSLEQKSIYVEQHEHS